MTDTAHVFNPTRLRDDVIARRPISAGGLQSEKVGGAYAVRVDGVIALAYLPDQSQWAVDTWIAERHTLVDYLARAIHGHGLPIVGVARIREPE